MEMQGSHITWSWPLVLLSYAISVLGAYTSLLLMSRVARQGGSSGWLVGAAFAMGGGAIWAMHFIGMLAARMNMPVSYEPWMTTASLLLAVAVSGLGLWLAARGERSVGRLVGGGVFAGLGVAGMHYLGMSAMRMPARLTYDRMLVGVSVVIAVVAATAALWIAISAKGTAQRLGGAAVMGVAVCGMHYTGMLAARMVPIGEVAVTLPSTLPPGDLAFYVFMVTATVLAAGLFFVMRASLFEETARP